MAKVLLTGFETFGNSPLNPAESVTRALDGMHIDDTKVVGIVVPNTFFECIEIVRNSIEEVQPEVVVMMGEYGGHATITVERIAQNFNDSTRYQLQEGIVECLCRVSSRFPMGQWRIRALSRFAPWSRPCALSAFRPTYRMLRVLFAAIT